MTRAVGFHLQEALEQRGGDFAPALCIEITRTDGEVFRYTSWDAPLTVGGNVYKSAVGVNLSAIENNGDGAVDQMQASLLLNTSDITEGDILAGKWHGATVRLFLVHGDDPSLGTLKLRYGWLGNISLDRGQARCEFLGLMQHFQSTIGEVVTKTCLNEFCGSINSRGQGCGLDIDDYTVAGAVTGWDGDLLVIDSADLTGYANNYFNGGKVTFDDQDWITFGVLFSIQADGIVKLKTPPPFAVTAGMAFTISRGCDKEHETCIGTYSNGDRFRGFPHLKGNDKLVQFGRRNGS